MGGTGREQKGVRREGGEGSEEGGRGGGKVES